MEKSIGTPFAIESLARGVRVVLIFLALLATIGVAVAHRHTITDSEMRDLRALARGATTPDFAPVFGFTAAELRDLRAEARIVASGHAGDAQSFSLTQSEIQDLRHEAKNHSVIERAAGTTPFPAFTAAELNDLRQLARRHGMRDDTGLAAGAR